MTKVSSMVFALGMVLMISGIVFALQGYGFIGSSIMNGNSFWIYAGSGIALFGLALIALGYIMRMELPGRKDR